MPVLAGRRDQKWPQLTRRREILGIPDIFGKPKIAVVPSAENPERAQEKRRATLLQRERRQGMTLAPVRFGTVYEIRSRALDAAERAEALVLEKNRQGVEADFWEPMMPADDAGSLAWVYTNEGDDYALDAFMRFDALNTAGWHVLNQLTIEADPQPQKTLNFIARFFTHPDSPMAQVEKTLQKLQAGAEKRVYDTGFDH